MAALLTWDSVKSDMVHSNKEVKRKSNLYSSQMQMDSLEKQPHWLT